MWNRRRRRAPQCRSHPPRILYSLPQHDLVSPLAGEIWFASSVLVGLLLFGLAVFFFASASPFPSDATNARRAVSFISRQFWQFHRREKHAPGEAPSMFPGEERLCLESRRHGIVLVRPLGWAVHAELTADAGAYAATVLTELREIAVGEALRADGDAVAPLEAVTWIGGGGEVHVPVAPGETIDVGTLELGASLMGCGDDDQGP